MTRLGAGLAIAAVALTACTAGGDTSAEPSGNEATFSGLKFAPNERSVAAVFDCLDEAGAPVVSAHRGGPYPGLPENAVETIADGAARFAGIFEVDVRTAADGTLVLMHDETLDRTTQCTGPVGEKTGQQILSCTLTDNDGAPTDFYAPSLAEALEWANERAILQLDIKRNTAFEDVLTAVRQADATHRVLIITYSLGAARRIASLDPTVAMSVTIESETDLDQLIDDGVNPNRIFAWTGTETPNPALYAALDARGVQVIFGTLGRPDRSIDGAIARSGDEARYAQLGRDGVDILATDRPREAATSLATLNEPSDEIAACLADG